MEEIHIEGCLAMGGQKHPHSTVHFRILEKNTEGTECFPVRQRNLRQPGRTSAISAPPIEDEVSILFNRPGTMQNVRQRLNVLSSCFLRVLVSLIFSRAGLNRPWWGRKLYPSCLLSVRHSSLTGLALNCVARRL